MLSTERTLGFFYRARVRDAMNPKVVVCSPDAGPQEMAERMRHNDYGSVVVVADGHPKGIVTERDLVYKVLADGALSTATADRIMSSPLVTVTPDDHIYHALYLMMKHRCRRLVVVDLEGQPIGMISAQGLLRMEGVEGRVITDHIDQAHAVEQICEIRADIDEFIHKLFLGDVDSRSLAEILTDYNDAMTRRIIVLNEQRLRAAHRAPAAPFSWICFGSEGRREQVMRGDQDNGIIIGDQSTPDGIDFYRELARAVNDDLAACGFDLCDGGVMAREDKYFGTLEEWRHRVFQLVHGSGDGRLLRDLTIFLDARCVAGDPTLLDTLWTLVFAEMQQAPFTLRILADDAVNKPLPLHMLGRFHYEKDAQGRKGIDIKRHGTLPLVAGVKAMAVAAGLRVTSTAERIEALRDTALLSEDLASDLLTTLDLLLKLKLQDSLGRVFHGQESTSFIFPSEWTEWERENLRRAFRAIGRLQDHLRMQYHL